ncbi:MAG: stage III sporulation protein AE [Clostridia bacterium]|nr:stage III sporulation protein AE [Clostridia bacterium]
MILACIFAFVVCVFTPKIAYAQNDNAVDISSETEKTINALDTGGLQDFIDSRDDEDKSIFNVSNIKEYLENSSGNGDAFALLWTYFLSCFKDYFIGFLPSAITIIFICLLKNILSNMTSGFLDHSTTDIVSMVCHSLIILVLASGVTAVVECTNETINNLTNFSGIIFPLLLTLLSTLGASTGISAYQPMMAVLSGGIMQIISKVITPVFVACIVFSMVGNLTKTIKFTKLNKFLRSGASWLVGIVFGLYGMFLTVGGISGGIVDKVGYNAAKFALSSYVPVLGGYLSDGFDLVTASLVLVKNSVGYVGVIVLIAIAIFPLLKILSFSLMLRLAAAVVEPSGDESVSNMLTAVADNTKLLIASVAGVSFMFFVLIMLTIGTLNFI